MKHKFELIELSQNLVSNSASPFGLIKTDVPVYQEKPTPPHKNYFGYGKM